LSRHLAESGEAREGIAADAERSTNAAVWAFIGKNSAKTRSMGETENISPTIDTGGANVQVAYCIPINDKATRHMGGGKSRNHDGSGNGLGVGKPGDPCPTLTAGDKHAVCAGFDGFKSVSGSIQYQDDKAATLEAGMPGNVINCQPSGISGTVSSKWAKGTGGPAGDEHYNLVCTGIDAYNHQETGDQACTLTASSGSSPTHSGPMVMTNISSVDCRNFSETDKHGTLQAKENGGQSLNYMGAVRTGYSVRRLTPLECDRLQNYPDNWTLIPGASDSARYKADGNSIAVCCAEYVLEGIKEVLEVTHEK
jgi:site-specific DNA-cytosine methylase